MYYNFIIYEEHKDLFDYVKNNLSCAISPLHTDGEGKPHYHVLTGPISNHHRSVLSRLKATIICPTSNPISYYRYLWHDPSLGEKTEGKKVYKEEDIIICKGFELPKPKEDYSATLYDIINIIYNNNLGTLTELLLCVKDNKDYISYIMGHSSIVIQIIKESAYYNFNKPKFP